MTTYRSRTPAPRASLALVALVAALALASCSPAADDADDVASEAEGDELDQALAFAQCMRDEGIDMPDPASADAEGMAAAFLEVSETEDVAEIRSAVEACRDLLPAGVTRERAGLDPERELELAECLRDQGLDVPDDIYSGDGLPEGVTRDELAAAMETCREVLR